MAAGGKAAGFVAKFRCETSVIDFDRCHSACNLFLFVCFMFGLDELLFCSCLEQYLILYTVKEKRVNLQADLTRVTRFENNNKEI